MAAADVQKLLELDVEARLTLVQRLWDSIVEDANAGGQLPLSASERELLDQRLREDDEHPDAAIPWPKAKTRLRRKR